MIRDPSYFCACHDSGKDYFICIGLITSQQESNPQPRQSSDKCSPSRGAQWCVVCSCSCNCNSKWCHLACLCQPGAAPVSIHRAPGFTMATVNRHYKSDDRQPFGRITRSSPNNQQLILRILFSRKTEASKFRWRVKVVSRQIFWHCLVT